MPASYITNEDRNFSTDLSYRRRSPDVYSEAASNLMALPSQMTLLDVKRKQLEVMGADRERRKDIFNEDQRVENENELGQFQGFLKGTKGMSENERAEAMTDWKLDNPWALDNERIGSASKNLFDASDAELKARGNVLQRRRQTLDEKRLAYDEEDFGRQADLADLQTENAIAQGNLTKENVARQMEASNAMDVSKVGEFVATSGAFGEEDKEARNKLIALTGSLFSEDGGAETLRGIAKITGALAMGNQIPEIYRSKMSQHRPFIQQARNKFKINLDDLPDDPVARAEGIAAVAKLIGENGTPQEKEALNAFLKTRANYDRARADVAKTKEGFIAAIDEINELRYSTDPKAPQMIRDKLAVLKATAATGEAYYRTEFDREQRDFERRKQEAAISNDLSMIEKRRFDADIKVRDVANKERKAKWQEVSALYTEKNDLAGLYLKAKDAEALDAFNVSPEATFDEFAAAMEKSNPAPQPGMSGRGIR